MDWNPGTQGEDFPASSQSGLATPAQGLLLSWILTPPVNIAGVGSAGTPGRSHLGAASLPAPLHLGLMGLRPASCRRADAASDAPLASGLCKGGGSLSASLPTPSNSEPPTPPTSKLSPGGLPHFLYPSLDPGAGPGGCPFQGLWGNRMGVTE